MQNPESIEPQGFPGCIFFGNKRQIKIIRTRSQLVTGSNYYRRKKTVFKKIIGILLKYLLLIGILALQIFSLYHGATTITEETDRNICIWKNALMISAIVGAISSLLTIDSFNILITGKSQNIIEDICKKDSQDVAVMYNGLVVEALFIPAICILNIMYFVTGNRLFPRISVVVLILAVISTIVCILADYLQIKQIQAQSFFTKLSDPVILPVIICMIQMLITREKWVGYIYHNICKPENDFFLTLSIIVLSCYFLAVAFCYFSNVYCLIGFGFVKRDLDRIEEKINCIQEKKQKQEALLRQKTKSIDANGEQGSFVQKVKLIIPFYIIHIKTYALRRFYAGSYLLSLLNFSISKWFSGLLKPDRIRINGIRFCLMTAVLELLSVDFILFLNLESDSPCLKFFELLSTVIIIPIFLTWLADLKSKTDEKDQTKTKEK